MKCPHCSGELSEAPDRTGWKLVPVDATLEMQAAGAECTVEPKDQHLLMSAWKIWRRMLAAAPAQPAYVPQPQGGKWSMDVGLSMVWDAERYRWLRNKSVGQYDHPLVVEQQKKHDGGMLYTGPVSGETLDRLVDAAMAAEPSISAERSAGDEGSTG